MSGLRRFLPQTLPAWMLLIVIASLLVSQAATLSIVWRDQAATSDMVDFYRLDERASSLVQLMSASAPAERKRLAAGLSNPNLAVTVSDGPAVTSSIAADDALAELEDIMVGSLTKFGVAEVRVRRDSAAVAAIDHKEVPTDADAGAVEQELLALAKDFGQSDRLTTSIQFADGQWLNFILPVTPVAPVLSVESLPLYGLVGALVVIMSIWALRRLTAPYRLMEFAVRRIGEDLKSAPVSEIGSREYRAAARAVNAMQARLLEYVQDREQLAAALAHDLRTPLTRMRLRLEMMKNAKLRAELMHDVGDIEAIARSVVDFATFEVAEEKTERIDFWSLLDSVADSFPEASFEADSLSRRGLVCNARPVALRRCVTNLIENAIKYGKKAHISLAQTSDDILMTIVDEGPGIPQSELEAVFRPFVRVEKSRNRQTGGLGLGLTIARNIARSLGGDIQLSNNAGGGVRTELRLPRAA